MSKPTAPPDFAPAPLAPPSYAQAVGGVPPTSPYTPNQTCKYNLLNVFVMYVIVYCLLISYKRT